MPFLPASPAGMSAGRTRRRAIRAGSFCLARSLPPRASRRFQRKRVPGRGCERTGRRFQKAARVLVSESHGHDDVEISRHFFHAALRTAQTLRVFVLQLEADTLRLRFLQKVQQILGIQSDRQRLRVVLDIQTLVAFAQLLARRSNRQQILVERELDAPGTLGREEGHPPDRALQMRTRDQSDSVVALGKDLFVVGKVDIEKPRDQLAIPDGKKKMVLRVADFELLSLAAVHFEYLRQGLLWDK